MATVGSSIFGTPMQKSVYDTDYNDIVDEAEVAVPSAHDLAGALHNADTLADLNTKINDATLNDGTVVSTLTDQATIAWNLNSKYKRQDTATLGANRAIAAATNQVNGGEYKLIIKQDGGAPRTLSWNANYLFPGGTDPILSTGNNEVDIFGFISDGTNMIYTGRQYNLS